MADYSIRDIARMAGVSVGTVSRILNNAENVDEGIRRRTMEVIRQVNYRSGRRGRRAEQRGTAPSVPERTRSIALISPGMGSAWKSNELWASYMAGIETACQERRSRLTMYMADSKQEDIVREIVRNADGILVKMEDTLPDYVKELITLLPAVGFGAAHNFDPLPQVIVDNNAGGVIAAEELLKRGHRRIDAFGRDTDIRAGAGDRYRIWRNWLERHGIEGRFHEMKHQPFVPDDARAADFCRRKFAAEEFGEAVFCFNPTLASGFYRACFEHGLVPGRDISVFAFGDQEKAMLMTPALATVMNVGVEETIRDIIAEYCPGATRSEVLTFRLKHTEIHEGESIIQTFAGGK